MRLQACQKGKLEDHGEVEILLGTMDIQGAESSSKW